MNQSKYACSLSGPGAKTAGQKNPELDPLTFFQAAENSYISFIHKNVQVLRQGQGIIPSLRQCGIGPEHRKPDRKEKRNDPDPLQHAAFYGSPLRFRAFTG